MLILWVAIAVVGWCCQAWPLLAAPVAVPPTAPLALDAAQTLIKSGPAQSSNVRSVFPTVVCRLNLCPENEAVFSILSAAEFCGDRLQLRRWDNADRNLLYNFSGDNCPCLSSREARGGIKCSLRPVGKGARLPAVPARGWAGGKSVLENCLVCLRGEGWMAADHSFNDSKCLN